jgi:hypothetical protein
MKRIEQPTKAGLYRVVMGGCGSEHWSKVTAYFCLVTGTFPFLVKSMFFKTDTGNTVNEVVFDGREMEWYEFEPKDLEI